MRSLKSLPAKLPRCINNFVVSIALHNLSVATSRHVCQALFFKRINTTNLWCKFRKHPERRDRVVSSSERLVCVVWYESSLAENAAEDVRREDRYYDHRYPE